VVGRAADAAFALFRMRTARKRAQPTKKGGKDKRYNNDYNNPQAATVATKIQVALTRQKPINKVFSCLSRCLCDIFECDLNTFYY